MNPVVPPVECGEYLSRLSWPTFTVPACMGGMCRLRDSCRRYHSADRREPAERLCGRDGFDAYEPVHVMPEQAATRRALALIHAAA